MSSYNKGQLVERGCQVQNGLLSHIMMDLGYTGNKYLTKPHVICNALSSNYYVIQREIDMKNGVRVCIYILQI